MKINKFLNQKKSKINVEHIIDGLENVINKSCIKKKLSLEPNITYVVTFKISII